MRKENFLFGTVDKFDLNNKSVVEVLLLKIAAKGFPFVWN